MEGGNYAGAQNALPCRRVLKNTRVKREESLVKPLCVMGTAGGDGVGGVK